MKPFLLAFVVLLLLPVRIVLAVPDDVTLVTPASEAAEGLDLRAVSQLFQNVETLEDFEKALNDEDNAVNNLDLDDDGEVDFIRVVEQVSGDTHLIILQVPLGENDYQDVATIEVEKENDEYNLQLHGSDLIYGPDYYVIPTVVHVHTWPLVRWIYRPYYRPYRSAFYFGYYPRWWRPWRPVPVHVYRTRTVRYTRTTTFSVTRTSRVKTVHRVNYTPKSSTRVKKKTITRKTTVKKKTRATTKSKSTVRSKANRSKSSKTRARAGAKKTKDAHKGKAVKKKGSRKTKKGASAKSKKAGRKGKAVKKKGGRRGSHKARGGRRRG